MELERCSQTVGVGNKLCDNASGDSGDLKSAAPTPARTKGRKLAKPAAVAKLEDLNVEPKTNGNRTMQASSLLAAPASVSSSLPSVAARTPGMDLVPTEPKVLQQSQIEQDLNHGQQESPFQVGVRCNGLFFFVSAFCLHVKICLHPANSR